MKGRVFVDNLHEAAWTSTQVSEALSYLQIGASLSAGSQVFIKPNLTWPTFLPGVTTSYECIEAVVAAFSNFGCSVTIGEADGGYHAFLAEEAFAGHGLHCLESRYGARLVNLSKLASNTYTSSVAGQEVEVELPRYLVEDVDFFITLPVPKVHAMTGVSLAFKNQWGCIPKTMRLRDHPEFSRKVLAINRLVNPRLVVFDGRYFLDRNGPMAGVPVEMNLIIASDDIGAGSFACCDVMGIRPMSISQFRVARREKMFPSCEDEFMVNQPLAAFRRHKFTLKRTALNWVALAAFHNRLGTRLLYDSTFAAPLHRVLYAIRRKQPIKRLLYGELDYQEQPRIQGG